VAAPKAFFLPVASLGLPDWSYLADHPPGSHNPEGCLRVFRAIRSPPYTFLADETIGYTPISAVQKESLEFFRINLDGHPAQLAGLLFQLCRRSVWKIYFPSAPVRPGQKTQAGPQSLAD